MFYKAIGFVIWKLARAELRRRYGGALKPGAAAATALAIGAAYVATRTRNGE